MAIEVSSADVGAKFVDSKGRTALLWSSIALAVFTSALQAIITTTVSLAEDQGMWTFRFRLARFEHWWWTAISALLAFSFGLIVLSFLAGNNNDSLGVLVLSTATAIAIVQYAIPAWRSRHFIENRWLAWTGSSRTAVDSKYARIGGDASQWSLLLRHAIIKRAPQASDDWGYTLSLSHSGITNDPLDILQGLDSERLKELQFKDFTLGPCFYDDGIKNDSGEFATISLRWGMTEGFQRRVSRAITSVPAKLRLTKPVASHGYSGEGLALAMGILGRNKGLQPYNLVFDHDDKLKQSYGLVRSGAKEEKIVATLEKTSSWSPRPNKVLRSYYEQAIFQQYSGLGGAYVGAAAELALILVDTPPSMTQLWLQWQLEQQDLQLNLQLSPRRPSKTAPPPVHATADELRLLYRAQYVSMVISLNYFIASGPALKARRPIRPDLHCFALLHLAEPSCVAATPAWWAANWVQERLEHEISSLHGLDWKKCAAWLLGHPIWPQGLDLKHWPTWPSNIHPPKTSDEL